MANGGSCERPVVVVATGDDWFRVPDYYECAARYVGAAPLPRINSTGVYIHRTHLPLLPAYEIVGNDFHAGALSASPSWPVPPRPWQPPVVDFIRSRRGSLITDQMRLGKTYPVAMSWDPSLGPLVVVCPLSVRHVWSDWIEKCHGEAPSVLSGRKFDPSKIDSDKLVIHYDLLPSWHSLGDAVRPGMLVFDESHLLSNLSQRTRSALWAAAMSRQVVCMTGTPLYNKIASLQYQLAVAAPGAFGAWRHFALRYCGGVPGTHGVIATGPTNVDELTARLSELRLGRTWKEVCPEASQGTAEVHVMPVSADLSDELDVQVIAMREAATVENKVGAMARYRRILGMHKAIYAKPIMLELAKQYTHLVVWSWHKDVAVGLAKVAAKEKLWAKAIHGDVSAAKRGDIIEEWRQKGGVLSATMAVAQVGIDLSVGQAAIYAEIDWTPAVISQSRMRTYDPASDMAIHYVTADHWLDRKIVDTVALKVSIGSEIGLLASEPLDLLADDAEDSGNLDRLMATILTDPETAI